MVSKVPLTPCLSLVLLERVGIGTNLIGGSRSETSANSFAVHGRLWRLAEVLLRE